MNNLLSYCGLVDARIIASEKNLPVCLQTIFRFDFRMLGFKHLQENIVEISAVALSQIQKDR